MTDMSQIYSSTTVLLNNISLKIAPHAAAETILRNYLVLSQNCPQIKPGIGHNHGTDMSQLNGHSYNICSKYQLCSSHHACSRLNKAQHTHRTKGRLLHVMTTISILILSNKDDRYFYCRANSSNRIYDSLRHIRVTSQSRQIVVMLYSLVKLQSSCWRKLLV